jgi:hypothetical protein
MGNKLPCRGISRSIDLVSEWLGYIVDLQIFLEESTEVLEMCRLHAVENY